MSAKLYYKTKAATYRSAQIVDLYLKAQSSDSSDPNVFVFEVLPRNYNQQPDTIFSHIASPVDMQDYRIGYTHDATYFREDNAVLRFNKPEQAQEALYWAKKGIQQLNQALDFLDRSDSQSYTPA